MDEMPISMKNKMVNPKQKVYQASCIVVNVFITSSINKLANSRDLRVALYVYLIPIFDIQDLYLLSSNLLDNTSIDTTYVYVGI